jgi:hypothetical protein
MPTMGAFLSEQRDLAREVEKKSRATSIAIPDGLHPETVALVLVFAAALAKKLRSAEIKYGYTNAWAIDDWETECRMALRDHISKGDPLDVAAYAAFMWKRGWPTGKGK